MCGCGNRRHALHVSTRYLQTGLLFKHKDPVLDVLFLEEVNGNGGTFRRVGVGRIFEQDLLKEFKAAEASLIQLV